MGETDELLLPAGTCLVHVGPHKTGTTAVQDAFHRSRAEIADHGVVYAGRGRQPYPQVQAFLGHRGIRGAIRRPIAVWDELASEVRDAEGQGRRVVLSCESLDNARRGDIDRLVADLGGPDRLHVVRMLRRYDRLMPSQWQQSVVNGARRGFTAWMRAILEDPESDFWHRHGYARQAQMWVDALGAERVTLVVVDETDPRAQLDVFERMTGLPSGLLPLAGSGSNRSLTSSEVALAQGLGKQLLARGWSDQAHLALVRGGLKNAVKTIPVDADEPRLGIPGWAVEAVVRRGDEEVEAVRRLGVRVVGDLESLRMDASEVRVATPQALAPRDVPALTVAVALVSVVEAARSRPGLVLPTDPATASAQVPVAERRPAAWPPGLVARSTVARVLAARALAAVVGRRRARSLLGDETDERLLGEAAGPERRRAPAGAAGQPSATGTDRPLAPAEAEVVRQAERAAREHGWSEEDVACYVLGSAVSTLREHEPPGAAGADGRTAARVPVGTAVRVLIAAAEATAEPTVLAAAAQRWRPTTSTPSRDLWRRLLRGGAAPGA